MAPTDGRRQPWKDPERLATGRTVMPTLFSTQGNATLRRLPCLRRWSEKSLAASVSAAQVELTAWAQQSSAEFVLARGREAEFAHSRDVHTKPLTLAAFWQTASNRSSRHYYSGAVADWGEEFAADADGLLAALSIVDAPSDMSLERGWMGSSGPLVWMGSEGVVATPHYDTSLNLVLQVFGVKRWLLWPPDALIKALPMHPSTHPSRRQARVRLTDETNDENASAASAFRAATKGRAIRIDTRPGDLLFVPPYWTHAVESHTAALSLSVLSPSWTEAVAARIRWNKLPNAFWLERLATRSAATRVVALCLYLRELVPRLFGVRETAQAFVATLYALRHARVPDGGSSGDGGGATSVDVEQADLAAGEEAAWASNLTRAACLAFDGMGDDDAVADLDFGGAAAAALILPSKAEVAVAVEQVRGVLNWQDGARQLSSAVATEAVRGHVEELAVWAVGEERHGQLLQVLARASAAEGCALAGASS